MAFKRTRKDFEADLQAQQSPYVFYGTSLPPLDPEVRDDGSYVPVWQQEVRDERGRKRLHGAFTGGFSAGYFNTVGSKDGWTPSTFISSRSNRAKDVKDAAAQQTQQRPEDFMDEEDLAEAAQAQKLETNEKFAGLGSTDQDEQAKAAWMSIFRPQGEPVGIKLLRHMGWREGQGIGPRRKRTNDLSGDGEDSLVAPKNSKMIQFNRKDDRKGLGYRGEARLNEQSNKASEPADDEQGPVKPLSSVKGAKPKTQPRKGAFGVGVLNDDGSDDDDPYSTGPRIGYKKSISASQSKESEKHNAATVVKPTASTASKSKHSFRPKAPQPGGRLRTCHDGRMPLDRFVLSETLASLSLGEDDKYAPPKVPDDWTPSHAAAGNKTSQADYVSTADAAKASTLDVRGRAAVLGETQLPGKSIFDFMSASSRDHLAAASKNPNLPPGRGEELPVTEHGKADVSEVAIPSLEKVTAQEALRRGAVGNLRDASEAKRLRYECFLKYRAELEQSPPEPVSCMTAHQWSKELDEFVVSARVFKPMSGVMASRFKSAGVSKASDDNLKQGLANKQDRAKNPAEEAASKDMFGPMTRSHQQFFPTRLVCKRFGVRPPPHVEDESSNQPTMTSSIGAASSSARPTTELVSEAAVQAMKGSASFARGGDESGQSAPAKKLDAASGSRGNFEGMIMAAATAAVDESRNDALEGERAGDEVFRAVFGEQETQ